MIWNVVVARIITQQERFCFSYDFIIRFDLKPTSFSIQSQKNTFFSNLIDMTSERKYSLDNLFTSVNSLTRK
jgi:hypothetical protein